jgi:ABC-2 type transport system ATP-binding protein
MNVIEIKNYTKIYKTGISAVENLNLNLKKGCFFGFVGPNGAGKTTTVNFIAGLIKPTGGELCLFGNRIKNSDYSYKRRMGVVLHKPFFLKKLTGEEYLRFVGQMNGLDNNIIRHRIKEILDFFELSVNNKKHIDTYSTGMQKKISLAAALIHDPELLILDEPFEGIDATSFKRIRDTLQVMVGRGKTIFLTSHILDTVEKLCDEIGIIHEGRLVFRGTLAGIKKIYKDKSKQETFSSLEELFHHLVPRKEVKLSWIREENR